MTTLRAIIHQFFDLKEEQLPLWLKSSIKNNSVELKSYLWSSSLCDKIRLSELCIQNKFYAESLVIYPKKGSKAPIFGTEYLRVSDKKYFGVIDFHPVTDDCNYTQFLNMFSEIKHHKSKLYDFDKFFSKKMWMRRDNKDFYNNYQIMVKCFLHQYKKCISSYELMSKTTELNHLEYNHYMSTNDPAYGILKSYFDHSFAEKYITEFLFSNK